MSGPPISDVGLTPMPPDVLERLGPVVESIIRWVDVSLRTQLAELPPSERTFVLRSVKLSLAVHMLARERPAMRVHLLAQIPRLVEVEIALAERGGRVVS